MDISTENKTLSRAEEKTIAILLNGRERFMPTHYKDKLQLLVESVHEKKRSPEEREKARWYYARRKETSAYKREQERKRKVKEKYLYLKNREKKREGNFLSEGETRAYLFEQWLRSHRAVDK